MMYFMKFITFLLVVVTLFKLSKGWALNEIDIPCRHGKEKDSKLSIIYPNTKWCGIDNIADNYCDLGRAWRTDSCCREHDLCSDIIPAKETKHGITNQGFFTRLSCECDERFRRCLRRVNRKTANQIGRIYFNFLSSMCFREDYPVVGCRRYCGWPKKCVEPLYDTTGAREYQWFDVPNY